MKPDKKERLKTVIKEILAEENLTPMDLITMEPNELKAKIDKAVAMNKPIVKQAFDKLKSNSQFKI